MNPTPFLIQEYWFTPPAEQTQTLEELKIWTNKAEKAFKEEIDRTFHKTYVFAKPVFKTSFAGYPDNDGIKWEVRFLAAFKKPKIQTDTNKDTLDIGIPGKSGEALQPCKLTKTNTLEVKAARVESLLKLIDQANANVKQKQDRLKYADAMLRKLNKLAIYLLKTVAKDDVAKGKIAWPYKEEATGPKTIEKIERFFNDFNNLFGDRVYITETNQEKISDHLSLLNRGFRETGMNISDISWKITSKQKRSTHAGQGLFSRIQYFVKKGIEGIDWDDPNLRAEDLIHFLQSIKEQAQSYSSDVDFDKSKKQLQEIVNDVVEPVMYYDDRQKKTVLCDFCLKLFKEVHAEPPAAVLLPISWMLEAIIKNKPKGGTANVQEPFVKYMQWPRCKDKLTNPEVQKIVTTFFPKPEGDESLVWESVADFLVGLGDPELFKVLADRTIKENTWIPRYQIDYIFHRLNEYLSVETGESKQAYKDMVDYFLKRLAKFNRLHFLKPYAQDPANQALLKANLTDSSSKGLDYTCMEQVEDLSSFFGNAAYKALEQSKQGVIPNRIDMQRTLVRLFSGYGSNKVNEDAFFDAMSKFINDYMTGFEPLFVEVLGRLGDLSESKDFNLTVDAWLKEIVMKLYSDIKEFVILSLPLHWKDRKLADVPNLVRSLVLHSDKLYVAQQGTDGAFRLKEWLGDTEVDCPESALVSDDLSLVKKRLKDAFTVNEGSARRQVSTLTENYLRFNGAGKFTNVLNGLKQVIRGRMQMEEAVAGSFEKRMGIWVEFFKAISPFFNDLEKFVGKRFFNEQGNAKKPVIRALVTKHRALLASKTQQVDESKYAGLPQDDATAIPRSQQAIDDISNLVAPLCEEEIGQVLRDKNIDLATLGKVANQFDDILGRRLDDLSYTDEEFMDSFADWGVNKTTFEALRPGTPLRNAINSRGLTIKTDLIRDHGEALLQRKPPIHFMLPNQAIAMELCTSPSFRHVNGQNGTETNLLLKLGTGQGKSVVIAKAALEEAKIIRDSGRPGIVLVITSYDHLAERDQELGQSFFKNENLKSVCITKFEDILAAFSGDPNIVYSDIGTLQEAMREVSLSVFQSFSEGRPVQPEYKKFIKAIFGIDGHLRVILDEYDLLLEDYKDQRPHIQRIPRETNLLDKDRVDKLKDYATIGDFTKNLTQAGTISAQTKLNPADGKQSRTASSCYIDEEFYFPIAILRVLQLSETAQRVIGLSGTSDQTINTGLQNRFYFEVPSSFDPSKFGTVFEGDGTGSASAKIERRKFEEIGTEPRKINENDPFYIIQKGDLEKYFKTIIKDIQAVQKEETDPLKKRPILIFAHPTMLFKHEEGGQQFKLWDELKKALKDEGIQINDTLTDKFIREETVTNAERKANRITDEDLQSIAAAGCVTIAPIKYARGSDIRVVGIDKGLHVIIATNLAHKKILSQAVGRTGRKGNAGSYSIITLGKWEQPDPERQAGISGFLKALHELTKLFMIRILDKQLDARARENLCQKWLVFTAAAFLTRWNTAGNAPNYFINRAHAREICGVNDNTLNTTCGAEYFKN